MINSEKKRVLIFVPTFPVLSETFIERELIQLSKSENLDITVFSIRAGSEPYNNKDLRVVIRNPTVIDIFFGLLTAVVQHPKAFMETFSLVFQQPLVAFANHLYIWIKSFGYAELIRRENPAHIHAHFFSQSSTICLYASILLGVPLSVSGHARDVFDNGKDNIFKPELISQKIHFSRFVTLCNQKAYSHCLQLAQQEDKYKVKLNYHGLPNMKSDGITPTSVNITDNSIFYIGRFVEKKGLMYLLDALRLLKDHKISFKMFFVGYGDQYQQLVDKVKTLKLEKDINFVNEGRGTPFADSLGYFKACAITVVPSINTDDGDTDGIPTALLDAGMLGKPVITTDAGSISEIAINGVNALVVKQKDSAELAAAILKLLKDSTLRTKLGQNLKNLVDDKFNLEKNIKKIEEQIL